MTAQTAALLQKTTALAGKDLDSPEPLDPTYIVPQNRTAGVRYVHAGNASAGMLNDAAHVNLALVDDLPPGSDIVEAPAQG